MQKGRKNQDIGIGKGDRRVKRKRKTIDSRLSFSSKYSVLSTRIIQRDLKNNTEGAREVRHTLQPLREVWMKLEIRVDVCKLGWTKVILGMP